MGNGNIWSFLAGVGMIIVFAVVVGWYAWRHRGTGTGTNPPNIASGH